jgi:DNA-directed RNA polymerase specialized sigma24 family protein
MKNSAIQFPIQEKREANEVFRKYIGAEGAERLELENRLAALMTEHAAAVVFQTFGQRRPDVAQDAVIKGLLGLHQFRGASLFSTWFHAVALNTARTALRKEIREGRSAELVDVEGRDEGDWWLQLQELTAQLDEEDQEFVRDKLAGRVEEELTGKYKLTVEGIRSRWLSIRKKIRRASE